MGYVKWERVYFTCTLWCGYYQKLLFHFIKIWFQDCVQQVMEESLLFKEIP